MGVLLFLVGYIVCIVLSMIILHRYKDLFDINYTPKENSTWQDDDYKDNASAILTFSCIWPIFFLLHGGFGLSKLFYKLSKHIEKKCSKSKT